MDGKLSQTESLRLESGEVKAPPAGLPATDRSRTVSYLCVCGAELQLDQQVGGRCESCGKGISQRQLSRELSFTVALPTSVVDLKNQAGVVDERGSGEGGAGDLDATLATGGVTPGDGRRSAGAFTGKRLGHFELLHQLGQGGMGQVYRALDTSLQRYVAVKVLRQASEGSEGSVAHGFVDKLLHEAVAQARVNHPNVVSIYYVGREVGDPFLAMELVPGETVETRLRGGSLEFAEIIRIALQITDALRVSYELDIIHGDIKPSNILLQSGGTAKLSDFGMAQRVSSSGQGAFGGTPNYLAPELLAGQRPSLQSDLYALGVTLYEMTFAHLPVELTGSSIREWAESHERRLIEFPSPWPEHLPSGWKTTLQRLLAKDPADRYSSYEELLAALYRLSPVQALPAKPLPRLFAAAIDYFAVGLVFVAVTLLAWFLERWLFSWLEIGGPSMFSRLNRDLPWYLEVAKFSANLAVGLSGFSAIGLYSLWVAFWRQSLGRAMLHVRVYNKYGLPPTARLLLARESLRMLIFWALPLVLFAQVSQWWATPVTAILLCAAGLFWLVDLGWMVFSRDGQALHDRLMETSVVLDTGGS